MRISCYIKSILLDSRSAALALGTTIPCPVCISLFLDADLNHGPVASKLSLFRWPMRSALSVIG